MPLSDLIATVALLAEGVDRNIWQNCRDTVLAVSPSSRRAWIEIAVLPSPARGEVEVALLAEGVDRNHSIVLGSYQQWMSPSSRRAWIEIPSCRRLRSTLLVALLAEGVDRNDGDAGLASLGSQSPSSRRAWIEMVWWRVFVVISRRVALLAEGVDRNKNRLETIPTKYVALLAEGVDRNLTLSLLLTAAGSSPSSRRAWIEISRIRTRLWKSSSRPPRGGRG